MEKKNLNIYDILKGSALRDKHIHRADVENISNCIIGMYHGHYDSDFADYKILLEFCMSLLKISGATQHNQAVVNAATALSQIAIKRARK